MGTTADKLNYLLETKEAIKGAIEAKGVSVSEDATFRSYADKIGDIQSGGGGGGDTPPPPSGGAVNFRDYDGTILHSYTKDDFLALVEMPTLPTRQGLTCQGWNYTLEDARAYVDEYGKLDIGATYITDDGKTRLYITIAAEGRMDVPLYIGQTITNGVSINWGDGSTSETLEGTGSVTATHHYNEIGNYIITLEVADECTLTLGHSSSSLCVMGNNTGVYCNMLKKVEVGMSVKNITMYAFSGCNSLVSITLPQNIISIGTESFRVCYSLKSIVIPSSVTTIWGYAFRACASLTSVSIPKGVTTIKSQAFYYCYSLTSVIIPSSITIINGETFHYCYALVSVVIPSSVTSISTRCFARCYSLNSVVMSEGLKTIGGQAFDSCYSLASIVIPQSVTTIESQAFINCYSLNSVALPTNVNKIGYYNGSAFSNCYALSSIVIPQGNTVIYSQNFQKCVALSSIVIPEGVTTIEASAFLGCYSLTSITVPSSVTSIGQNAFQDCSGMAFYDFSALLAIPTLSATSAFLNIPSDCKIIVPDSLYDSWIAASNWSTYASQIIKASEYNE